MFKKLLLAGLFLILASGTCFAAGTMVLASDPVMDRSNAGITVSLNWVGDSSTGTVPAKTTNQLTDAAGRTVSSYISGYFFYAASFDPGTPSPTASYSVVITDALGATIATFSSLSATASTYNNAGASGYIFALAPLLPWTITLSGNSVASAQGKIIFSFVTAH